MIKENSKNYVIYESLNSLRITEIEKNIRVSQRKRVLKNITV